MTSIEKRTLQLLESLHSRYVCMVCGNSGGEGQHQPGCELFELLKAWRERFGTNKYA